MGAWKRLWQLSADFLWVHDDWIEKYSSLVILQISIDDCFKIVFVVYETIEKI